MTLGDAQGLEDCMAVIATPDLELASLEEATAGLDYTAVVVCSVVPEKRKVMEAFFSGIAPIHFVDHRSPIGMAIDYPNPEGIGADRLANAAGVQDRHGVPVVVVDFGTAVTFDVISSQPAYCGGVIAPGLGAMSGYLSQKTALLGEIELEEPSAAIGKSTEEAMRSGAVYGYRGLVREIIGQVRQELTGATGEEVRVVATGGDAELIARGLEEIEVVDRHLTLEGLRLIAGRVFAG